MKTYEILNEQNCQKTQVVSGIKKRSMDRNSVTDGLFNKKSKVSVNNLKKQPITCPKEPCNEFLKLMVSKRIQLQRKKNINNSERIRPCSIKVKSNSKEKEDSSSDEESLSLKQLKHNCELTKSRTRKRKKSEEDEWSPLGTPYTALVYTQKCYELKTLCSPAVRSNNDIIAVNDCVEVRGEEDHSYFAKVQAIFAGFDDDFQKEIKLSVMWFYSSQDEIKQDIFDMKNEQNSAAFKLHFETFKVYNAEKNEEKYNDIILHKNELYCSNHMDCISACTVKRRCHVLSYNHYCRVQKRLKQGKKLSLFDTYQPDENDDCETEENKFFYQRPFLKNEVVFPRNTKLFFCRRRYETKNGRVNLHQNKSFWQRVFKAESTRIKTDK